MCYRQYSLSLKQLKKIADMVCIRWPSIISVQGHSYIFVYKYNLNKHLYIHITSCQTIEALKTKIIERILRCPQYSIFFTLIYLSEKSGKIRNHAPYLISHRTQGKKTKVAVSSHDTVFSSSHRTPPWLQGTSAIGYAVARLVSPRASSYRSHISTEKGKNKEAEENNSVCWKENLFRNITGEFEAVEWGYSGHGGATKRIVLAGLMQRLPMGASLRKWNVNLWWEWKSSASFSAQPSRRCIRKATALRSSHRFCHSHLVHTLYNMYQMRGICCLKFFEEIWLISSTSRRGFPDSSMSE